MSTTSPGPFLRGSEGWSQVVEVGRKGKEQAYADGHPCRLSLPGRGHSLCFLKASEICSDEQKQCPPGLQPPGHVQ